MANIRVDSPVTIYDGLALTFRSPADCSHVTGLIVYYPDRLETASQVFQFADAHGNNIGDLDLFAENAVVKVILDTDTNLAFVQNADTNAYLEGKFNSISSEHKIKTYSSLAQIGITAGDTTSETIPNIMAALPDASVLMYDVLSGNNIEAPYPAQYGTMRIYKVSSIRNVLEFSSHSSNTRWYGVFNSSFKGWNKIYDSGNLPTLAELGAAASGHKHAAGDITSGTLAVARGGTGVTSNPSMLTNLGSTSAASVFAASPRPGVTGTLPVANGGTGQTTATPAVGTSALRAIHAGTSDLTAGSSSLTTGAIYLVYE